MNDEVDSMTPEKLKDLIAEMQGRIQKEKDYDLIGHYVILILWKIELEIKNG